MGSRRGPHQAGESWGASLCLPMQIPHLPGPPCGPGRPSGNGVVRGVRAGGSPSVELTLKECVSCPDQGLACGDDPPPVCLPLGQPPQEGDPGSGHVGCDLGRGSPAWCLPHQPAVCTSGLSCEVHCVEEPRGAANVQGRGGPLSAGGQGPLMEQGVLRALQPVGGLQRSERHLLLITYLPGFSPPMGGGQPVLPTDWCLPRNLR